MAAMQFACFEASRIKFVDSKMVMYGMVHPKSTSLEDCERILKLMIDGE